MSQFGCKRIVVVFLAASLGLTWAGAEEKNKEKTKLLDPEAFVKQVGYINYGEIAAGMLATQRSTRQDVRAYGMKLVKDHTKANQDLLPLAAKNKWVLAGSADTKHQAIGEKLSRLQGADFDREFLSHMIMGHKEAIRMFEAQSKEGKDADVKSLVQTMLPTLREHLKEAEKLRGEAKDDKGTKDNKGSKEGKGTKEDKNKDG